MKQDIYFKVEKEESLSLFLKEKLTRKFYRNLKGKNAIVLVNDEEREYYKKVEVGDVIHIIYDDYKKSNWDFVEVPLEILYEDEHYLVVNKEHNILSIPTKSEPVSLYQQVLTHLNDKFAHISLLNRLDKETSGLVLIAKDRYSASLLQPVKEHIIRKYEALVEGTIANDGTIDSPIGKCDDSKMRKICENGKSAITHFKVLCYNEERTKLSLTLETGRTHQIRVHLASIGHPIVGDSLYGGQPYSHMCLTSVFLSYVDPYTNELKEFMIKSD